MGRGPTSSELLDAKTSVDRHTCACPLTDRADTESKENQPHDAARLRHRRAETRAIYILDIQTIGLESDDVRGAHVIVCLPLPAL